MKPLIKKIFLITALTAIISCGKKEATTQTSENDPKNEQIFVTNAQFNHSKMSLLSIEKHPFPITIKSTGTIDVPPENRAVVNATMGGYIKTTPFLIGDKVTKGQALVTIENPEFVTLQQNYMEVKEQITYLKAEYDRHLKMKEENITSQKSFLQAESSYKTAKAKLNGLAKQLQLLNISPKRVEAGYISSVVSIYAPISGSITKVNVTKGTYVSPATPIIEIINNEHIHLELSVFEKDIMKIKKGQLINFKIPEASTETFKAEVYLIGTVIDENRTIKLHAHLKNKSDVNFLVGMFAEAEIVTQATYSIALPETAIVNFDNANYVLKLSKQTKEGYYFNKILVKIGDTYNGYTSLTEYKKINQTDKILTKGAFSLINEE